MNFTSSPGRSWSGSMAARSVDESRPNGEAPPRPVSNASPL
jgi:hypothetical protein